MFAKNWAFFCENEVQVEICGDLGLQEEQMGLKVSVTDRVGQKVLRDGLINCWFWCFC